MLARAVILATGYSDRLHARSTGTREMSGDGIAMAWRVGRHLVNLEMQWWHTNDIADPPTWQRMQVYPNPMLGSEKSARMVNSAGEEFFNQQQDDPLAYGPYTVQLKALAKAGACRQGALRRRLLRRLRSLRCRRSRSLYDAMARPSASSGCGFPNNWSRPPSPRTTGKAASTSTPRPCARRFPGSMSPAALGGHSNGLIGLATYDGKVVADGVVGELAATCRRARCRKPRSRTERRRLEGLLAARRDGVAAVAR